MGINQKLNCFMAEKGVKQSYVSEKTGIRQDTLSKILNGDRRLLADEFLLICDTLGIDPNMLRDTHSA